MNKKAQDLSISTIIIAAVAVVVLVVLVAIFTGRLGIFTGVLGTSTAEKTKDSTLSSCIPIDSFYTAIETAQVDYNKADSSVKSTARENLDGKIALKNEKLTDCKQNFKAEDCKGNCQWVGS